MLTGGNIWCIPHHKTNSTIHKSRNNDRGDSTNRPQSGECPPIVSSNLDHLLNYITIIIIISGPPFGTQKLVPTLFLIHIFGKRASFQEAPWNEHIFFRAHLFLFWSVWFLSCWRDAGSAMLSHAWTKNKSNMHWYALVNLSNCTVNRMLTGWGQFVYLLFAQRVKG